MRHLMLALALLVVMSGQTQASARAPAPLDRRPVAFVDVNVVPMDRDTVLRQQTVVVRDGHIASIGPSWHAVVPAKATRIDGRGRFLMPGLADMHVHLRYFGQASDNPAMLQLFVANGVTTVLNLLGLPEHLALRDSIARGGVLAPVVYTSGFYVSTPFVVTPEQVDSAVIAQKRAGYDFVKMHGDLSAAAYHQLLVSVHREGMRLIGHAPRNLGFEVMLAEHHDVIAHAEEFIYAFFLFNRPPPTTLAEIDSMIGYAATSTAKAGIWLMPTLTCYRNISRQIENLDSVLARPEMRFVPRGIVAEWQPERNTYLKPPFSKAMIPQQQGSYWTLERLTKAFDKAGVRMLAGTDTPVSATPPGFALHEELANLVAAGLTPYRALRMATADADEFLAGADRFGTVTVGRRADLVLVRANPLADIHNTAGIDGVMVRGRWLPAPELRLMLEEIARANR